MTPKSQTANGAGDPSDLAPSPTKDISDAGSSSHIILDSHTGSPSASPMIKQGASDDAAAAELSKQADSSDPNLLAADSLSGPSPYGTRSRNRGQPRPNYAEDKDADTEMYDAPAEKKQEDAKKILRQATGAANGASDAIRSAASSTRKAGASDDTKGVNAHASNKDHLGGTDVSSATGSPMSSTSKKRKAPALSITNGTQPQIPSTPGSSVSNTTSTRRNVTNLKPTATANAGFKESNMLSFERCGARPKDGKMVADDGTVLQPNDHVFLVCEPPGEPYYLGRIMEFLHSANDNTKPVDALRINWFYRPKDIGRKVNDTRLVFATMHSDISPLTALRGKCEIRHKAEIENMEEYRKTPDCFWFEKLYDRYIQKNYDIIPCTQIVNVPRKVKKVLDERWRFILVEQGRGKEYTSAVKSCKRCSGYCANNDSVDCAVCKQTYHMNCVRPPLLKKPSRGFAWACAACSRAQEKKLEARHTPSLLDPHPDGEEEEFWDEEEEDHGAETNATSPSGEIDDTHQPATPEQMYHASLWPYRYLGIHCKPEDALDYDDRIYPRAGSRQGPKHQATVLPWPGRPVQLVKPLETRKGRKEGKLSKEAIAAIEAEKIARENRPKWIQDEPSGYVARGEDLDNDDPENTAQLLWKPAETTDSKITPEDIDQYMGKALTLAPQLELPRRSTNLMDVARDRLYQNRFDMVKSLKDIPKTERAEFKEPDLNATELKKFEEGVAKFGSELYHVKRHVKTVEHRRIVRFYYTWKKTDRGKQIWGTYSGRKGKKEAKKAEANASKLQDDVADDHDDSAFDTGKALERKRNFTCKFCSTKSSRQWRRAPNVSSPLVTEGGAKSKDKGVQYVVALCRRCAELWRRYAIQWEDMDELAKKVAAAGSRAWRRRVDEELLKELAAANEMMSATVYRTPTPAAQATATSTPNIASDPPRKKLKGIADKDLEASTSESGSIQNTVQPKKKDKVVEKPAPPPIPEIPKPRILPCAICQQLAPQGEQHLLACKECRLSVHRKCYGVLENRTPGKWTCDMCLNDKNPQISLEYKCVLCPVEATEHDFVEPPKLSHRKKTEKEKEKEKIEREVSQKAADYYRKKQEETNRPVNPREPLKRTADNNWVHVTCAVWTPEVKFGSAKALSPSEGIPSIPRARYDEVCKSCKQKGGACIACHQCRAPVHVECAHQNGYLLGFEVTPVKGSRRDQFNIVTINGETGTMSAAVWCKEHTPSKTVVHRMFDAVNQPENQQTKDSLVINALQFYVQNFKQADLALTGTVRKANLIAMATKTPIIASALNPNRRASTTTTLVNGTGAFGTFASENQGEASPVIPQSGDKVCITCGIDVSPKWWPIEKVDEKALINGHYGNLGTEAQKFMDQRSYQCHKCKKADRKPVAHVPPPSNDTTAEPDPVRPPPTLVHPLASPPPVVSEARPAISLYPRAPPVAPVQSAPLPPGPPPVVAAPPIQAPLAGPPPPLPLSAPHAGPGHMVAPITQSSPTHHYPPQSTPYSDWHRSATQHSPPLHHLSNASGGPNPLHLNHLRDLRPPPIAPIAHHPPSVQHASMGPGMVNGLPPSSPRRTPSLQSGPPPYLPSYHHQTHHPLHSLTNGGPPPRPSDPSFSPSILSQRSAFNHGNPAIGRDGLSMGRESSLSANQPPRPGENRPPSGASASPSLRNLLS